MATRARKSQATADREVSQVERLGAENAQLLTLVGELRTKLNALKGEVVPMDEYRRVQALLRVTQVKLAGASKAKPIAGSFRERCLAYFAATGERSVTPVQLREWEISNAQG